VKEQERTFLKQILIWAGTFNNSIVAGICKTLGKVKLTAISKGKDEFWMRLLRTHIICWKVLHGLDPRSNKYVDNHPLIQHLSAAVNSLVLRQGPVSDDTAKQLRLQYAQNICNTVKGISFNEFRSLVSSQRYSKAFPRVMLPSARVAIGDTTVLMVPFVYSLIQHPTSVKISFPLNMLQAAVAANQVEMVLKILDLLASRIPGNGQLGTWDEMHATGKVMVGALRVAVRTSRNDLGLLLCDFLREHRAVRQSIDRNCYETTWHDCAPYGNTTLFSKLLYWKKNDDLPAPNTDLTGLRLDKKEFLHVANNGRPTLIRHLVSTGILDPNRIEGRRTDGDTSQLESPLWLALSVRAYKVAKALIDCGADIDRRLPRPLNHMTAYKRAHWTYDGDAQYNLLLWGADFRPLGQHGQPWGPGKRERKPHIAYLDSIGPVNVVRFEEWRSSMEKGWQKRRLG
jgi:hypothetical protein